MMRALVLKPENRPYILLFMVAVAVLLPALWITDYLSTSLAYSTLQALSAVGLPALGLALTMLIGEFDLALAGVFGLAGCIAILFGNTHPALGICCAVLFGFGFGSVQGTMIAFMKIGSVPITLGGLLISTGLAYLVTGNRSLSLNDIDFSLLLNDPLFGVFSIRSIATLSIFFLAALIFKTTRLGRDLVAVGSDRRAALTSGVNVRPLIIGSFAFSSSLSALGGALLSLGLASASPSELTDILVPAIAASILGGITLSGGRGAPLGVLSGVLVLSALRSGLNAIAAPPFAHDMATGAILFTVAIIDAPLLHDRLSLVRLLGSGN